LRILRVTFFGIKFVAETGAHFRLRYFEESCPKPVAHLWCDRSRQRLPPMKAPDDCPSVVMPTWCSSGAGRPITCSCIKSRGTADESEAYFFRRLDCFGDDVVVRVGRTGDDLQICCSYQRNFYPIERMQKPLAPADWTRVEEGLAAVSFWTLDPIEEFRPMFDGSDWTIRGRQSDRPHCIKRRSPYGPIRDLCELFIELAGSEAINGYFEYPATFQIRS
jgi:hypothetical protein